MLYQCLVFPRPRTSSVGEAQARRSKPGALLLHRPTYVSHGKCAVELSWHGGEGARCTYSSTVDDAGTLLRYRDINQEQSAVRDSD